MKKILSVIAVCTVCVFAKAGLLPTNSVLSQAWTGAKGIAQSTNLAGFVFGGESIQDHITVVGAGLSYNITPILASIVALDYRFNNKQHVFTCVQGGLDLQLPVQPLATIGITNFWVTPFAGVLAANGSDGSVMGSIYIAGANVNLVDFGRWDFLIGIEYENCQGQGAFNENYIMGHIALSRNAEWGEPLALRTSHDQLVFERRMNRLEDWAADGMAHLHLAKETAY